MIMKKIFLTFLMALSLLPSLVFASSGDTWDQLLGPLPSERRTDFRPIVGILAVILSCFIINKKLNPGPPPSL